MKNSAPASPGSYQHARPATRSPTGAFYQWCADTELYRLAQTIQAWWAQIEAFIFTGAAGEGVNG
jgi:hypothetical protein